MSICGSASRFLVIKPYFHPRYNQVGVMVGQMGSPSFHCITLRFEDGEELNFDRDRLEKLPDPAPVVVE